MSRGSGGPIDCSSYFSPSGNPLPPVIPEGERPAAAQQLSDDMYSLVSVRDQSSPASVDVLVDRVLASAGIPAEGSDQP